MGRAASAPRQGARDPDRPMSTTEQRSTTLPSGVASTVTGARGR